MNDLLLVEDKESLGRMLVEALQAEKLDVDWVSSGTDAIRRLTEGRRYIAVLTDLRLPGSDGIDVLRQVKESDPDCPVIMMTAYGTIENAVEAMKIGAYDFIQKPIDLDHLVLLLRRCMEYRRLRFENILLREEYQKRYGFPVIVGDSPQIRAVSEQIQKVAPTESTVLLLGESGTGKELFARAIHQLSPRRDRPFVAINCAAIPDTLIENELFGHEKGAYTGAGSRQMGKFELANAGTIFLDEIAELGIGVQSKILRVLQERRFERIGGLSTISVNVRIVCATNRTLDEEVKAGRFREDLFFRINVFPVTIPPLRVRRSDVDALSDHFLSKFGSELGKGRILISEPARQILRDYHWPGNVRELENCIERAAILCDNKKVEPQDLNVDSRSDPLAELHEMIDMSGSLADVNARAVTMVERKKIAEALEGSTSRAQAAAALGVSYRTLVNKMREYGLEPPGAAE